MTEQTANLELDLRHEESPVPMIKTKETLDGMNHGEVLKVVVSKESAMQNIKTLMTNNHFELLSVSKTDDLYNLLIKKP